MLHAPTVWVVDDDADDQYFIERAFKQLLPSITIKQLTDGDEVIPCLQEAAVLPRLILLDLNMMRQNGHETLAELRRIPAYRRLPIVVFTTSQAEADKQKSLALGANGFLTKPPTLQGILQLLSELISVWNLN
ncbi:response regulator [Spirosoma sp.]|uniref:response regulator n=1 Tax=Spirosoma sp. TaxID=1899569 RepID=UPI00261F32C4|nr:response regulator [Spirosoma sp.]MCX6212875.1 response regulator [Spirosoma sp.]